MGYKSGALETMCGPPHVALDPLWLFTQVLALDPL
jgi:hypothetical protein